MAKEKINLISYHWEGVNRNGNAIKGVVEATNLAIAKASLRKQGIIVKKISKVRTSLFDNSRRKIKTQDITTFTRQLSTMIEAGIPLIQSFDIIGKSQKNIRFKELLSTIKSDIESGQTFSEALKKHPRYFNDLFCNLVESGEKSGTLEMMLDRIATYKEKMDSIRKKIKKALAYPIAILVVAFLVTAALLIFVVPEFETLFKGFGADLPAMTRAVISLSNFFQKFWYLIFGGLGGLVYGFVYAKRHSETFRTSIDRVILRLPILGPILEEAAIARFSRTLAITFAAGLPLVDALKTVAGATGNIIFSKATDKIREDVSIGQQMHTAVEGTHLFPDMVIQMIAIGEESGALEKMLGKVADFYEEAVDNAVDALSSLLEPIIMSVLGVLVGGLVIAMYLPIFKLGSVI